MSIFNRHVGKFIDSTSIQKMKGNWKKKELKTESVFIGRDIIEQLLKKDGCEGLRVVFGIDDEENVQPIFYAADDKGKIIKSVEGKDGDESVGADRSVPCPPYC
jgi:hypothetical protein